MLWKIVPRDRLRLVSHPESNAGMRLRLADAQRQSPGGGASGGHWRDAQGAEKVELERRFAAMRWQVALALDDYAAQVRRSADKGFAVDQGFTHLGICTIAVPIIDVPPGFCLSASMLAGSRDDSGIDASGADLIQLRSTLLPAK